MAEEKSTSKKRDRDDSGEFYLSDSEHESKRVHPVSCSSPPDTKLEEEKTGSPPGYNEGEIDEVKNSIPEDILDILDDADDMPEIQDLDSVIRSFEEEILHSSPSSAKPEVMELRSVSGEYQLDLGYLLEASDDELGLPPTVSTNAAVAEETQQEPTNPPPPSNNASEVADMVALENELPSYYDPLGFELGERDGEVDNIKGRFVTVDGLFEYPEPSDNADLAWLCGYT